MLRENLDPSSTLVGLDVKVLTGAVFAQVVADEALAADVRALAAGHGVAEVELAEAEAFAASPEGAPPDADPRRAALLLLGRAASPSPARIDARIVAACRDAGVSSAEVVELVCWISVLQLLHRLTCFYAPAGAR
jgi:alkylhydroperoxidase family enzyme